MLFNLKKMDRFYIYGLLFLGLTFSELFAVPPIPRIVLFPESGEKEDERRQMVRQQFPRGSLLIPQTWTDNMDNDESILVHSLPGSYRTSIYYYKDKVHRLNEESLFYIRYENTSYWNKDQQSMCFIWSGTRDPQGLRRVFYEFSSKDCASRVIAHGYDFLTVDERGNPIAGWKHTEKGLREYWVNSTDKGWTLFQTEHGKDVFSPMFVHNESQDALYYATASPSFFSINLRTGERKSLLTVVPQEGETYYPEESFRHYEGKLQYYFYEKEGKRYWRGTSLFNYIYKDLNDRLSAYFRGQDLCIDNLNCAEDAWYFTVILEREPPLHGAYMLDTRTLGFSNERILTRRDLRKFRDRLSQKTYRTCLVPPPYIRLEIRSCDEIDEQSQIFNYSTGSSLMVPYFLSIPSGRKAPYPTVMYVHGGPTCHDVFGYDATVQHLTSRGYAVVQVNYRGSTSNLRLFEEGVGEWGQGMQRDLSFVADALIQEGVIDPNAVAIMGRSYGGYASLLGATMGNRFHTQHFKGYKCAISGAPSSDLELLLRDFQRELGRPFPEILHGLVSLSSDWRISEEDAVRLRELSPLTHAAHLSIPLLLMHGREDIRVPPHHSDLFSEELTRAGHDHVYVVFEKEGHELEKSGNMRVAAYLSEQFLAIHLGGGEVEPPDIMDVAYTDMTFVKGADMFLEVGTLLNQYKGCGNFKLAPEVEKLLGNLIRREITSLLGLPTSPSSLISYQNPKMFLWRIFAQTFWTHIRDSSGIRAKIAHKDKKILWTTLFNVAYRGFSAF